MREASVGIRRSVKRKRVRDTLTLEGVLIRSPSVIVIVVLGRVSAGVERAHIVRLAAREVAEVALINQTLCGRIWASETGSTAQA